jgi:hypothetical protein
MILTITLSNRSKHPLAVGKIHIAQERFWTNVHKENLGLIRTSDPPDELAASDAPPAFGEDEDQRLANNAARTFTVTHHVYVTGTDLQHDGKNRKIIVSFHVTNVRKDGSFSDYWSDQIDVALPQGCDPQ